MRYASRAEFDAVAATDPYYKPVRWHLYSHVQEIARELDFSSVLELGPYKLPILMGSDTMDKTRTRATTLVHDARHTPWPLEDGSYDLFIALQVWEHLSDCQVAAFKEVRRIARQAIMSFPLGWNCPRDPTHHNITEDKISDWTCQFPPEKKLVVKLGNSPERIIYHFDFDKRSN